MAGEEQPQHQVTSADKIQQHYTTKRIREHLADGNSTTCATLWLAKRVAILRHTHLTVCPDELLAQLIASGVTTVPNMCPEILPTTALKVLGDKYIKILPEFSVVGVIFDDPAVPKLIVKAPRQSMMARRCFMAGLRITFEFADDFQIECKINRALATGIKNSRSLIVGTLLNRLFDALGKAEQSISATLLARPQTQPVVCSTH